MMDAPIFEFDAEKSRWLKENRNISFEEIIALMDDDHLLDVVEHRNKEKYGHQDIFVMRIAGYVYLVPFVKTGKKYFLKTIIPSRKATAKYKKEVKDAKS
ncbi:MAG: toxin [Minisyncoccia bacterium]